jgi:hypothetical protein
VEDTRPWQSKELKDILTVLSADDFSLVRHLNVPPRIVGIDLQQKRLYKFLPLKNASRQTLDFE